MSLDKARAALDAARDLDIDNVDQHGLTPVHVEEQFRRLLSIASIQANIAAAEAMERCAAALETLAKKGTT